MSEKLVERHAVKRGEIMRALQVEHPDYVSIGVIRSHLDHLGLPTETESIVSYLSYLADKGYVTTVRKKGDRSRISISMAALTAKGMDLMDQNNNLQDEGVAF
jgi:hypothetical protein